MILSSSPYYKDKVWHSIYNFGYRINISQRTHLISVFNDTMDCIQADARYRAAIELAISKQTLVLESKPIAIPSASFDGHARVIVSHHHPLEAAERNSPLPSPSHRKDKEQDMLGKSAVSGSRQSPTSRDDSSAGKTPPPPIYTRVIGCLATLCLWGALLLVAIVLVCNIVVLAVARGRCFSDIKDVPHCTYGILLGTGRSAAPSPYYDARVQAAIALLQSKKIDTLMISGENQYADYYEVDSMAIAILVAVPDAALLYDTQGVDTYTSMVNAGNAFTSLRAACEDTNSYATPCLIISQHFHNQRAVFYGSLLFQQPPVAYDAADTQDLWWRTRNLLRECLARTKAVYYLARTMACTMFA